MTTLQIGGDFEATYYKAQEMLTELSDELGYGNPTAKKIVTIQDECYVGLESKTTKDNNQALHLGHEVTVVVSSSSSGGRLRIFPATTSGDDVTRIFIGNHYARLVTATNEDVHIFCKSCDRIELFNKPFVHVKN